MTRKDYIPRGDLNFLMWTEKFMLYALANYQRWKVESPENIIGDSYKLFREKMENASDVNRGKIDVFAKNVAKKALIKACREYIQGFLARNRYVTSEDRATMGIPIYDTVPTPVLDPTGRATAGIIYKGVGILELKIKPETVTSDKRAEYGVRIYFGVYADSNTYPTSGMDLHESKFTRRKKELFIFQPDQSGKKAFFCMRYENSKGKSGPWGPLLSALIP